MAGGIVAGAGGALRLISTVIFSTFDATDGPFVNYAELMDLASTGLIGLGALIAGFGILHGIYTLWTRSRTADREQDGGRPERGPDAGRERQGRGGQRDGRREQDRRR